MISPASPSAPISSLDGQLLPGAIGGNLARVTCNALSSQTGHFLFLEQPQQFGAQYTDAGRVYLLSPASAGAVSRGFPSSHPPRPFHFVLPKVNHITHREAPIFVDETKFTRSAFA